MAVDPRAPQRSAGKPGGRTADADAGRTADAVVLREIAKQLAGLRYGSLEIVVHEGVVTQIERREKTRFPLAAAGPSPGRD
jgi:hypothetical protein